MTDKETRFTPAVGVYAMHHMHGGSNGTLVLIDSRNDEGCFSIQYVQVLWNGTDVIGGGSSSSWPASDFRPVTDPILLAAAKCFDAKRQEHDHSVKAARAKAEAEIWRRVVSVMHDGSKARGEPSHD